MTVPEEWECTRCEHSNSAEKRICGHCDAFRYSGAEVDSAETTPPLTANETRLLMRLIVIGGVLGMIAPTIAAVIKPVICNAALSDLLINLLFAGTFFVIGAGTTWIAILIGRFSAQFFGENLPAARINGTAVGVTTLFGALVGVVLMFIYRDSDSFIALVPVLGGALGGLTGIAILNWNTPHQSATTIEMRMTLIIGIAGAVLALVLGVYYGIGLLTAGC
jgi:hypothetical protein